MFCLITSATYGHLYSLFCWFRSAVWAKLRKKINQVQKYSIRTNGKNTHKTFASRWVPGSFIYQARHERKEKFKETTTAQSVFKVCFPQSTVRNSLLGIWEHLINSAWERGWRWEMEFTKKKKKGGNCISHLRKSNTFVKKADVKLHSWPADPIRTIPTTRYMITSRELLWSGRLILLSCSWPSWILAAEEEEEDDDVISCFTIMSDQRKPNCFCWRHRQRVEGRSRTPICYGPALARGVKWRIYYHPPAKGGCALTSDGNLSVILWDEGDQRFGLFHVPIGWNAH